MINYKYKNDNISTFHFFFISLKKNFLPFLFCFFIIFLVLFSNNNILATKQGLNLWANNVIPSLLPFFIATELLSYTDIVYKISIILNPIMRPIFNVPGAGAYALILGIISGYPTGAKIITKFKEENIITSCEAERLLSFTNNSGPLFIVGTVGISMFGSTTIGLLLLITHILACLSVGFLFRFWKKDTNYSNKIYKSNKTESVSFSNLGEVLSKSILSSINTIIMIGGFIVLFSVILSILQDSRIINLISTIFSPFFKLLGIQNIDFIKSFLCGIIEITNGIKQISLIPYKQISLNIYLTAFLLGFGGISVIFQVLSITSKAKISIKPYIIGKILQAFFALFYTILFTNFFPIFNLNL